MPCTLATGVRRLASVAVADSRAVRSERTWRRQVLACAGVPSELTTPVRALSGAVSGAAVNVEENASTVESLRLVEQECTHDSSEDDTGQTELHGDLTAN